MGWAPPDPRTCDSEENSFELVDEEDQSRGKCSQRASTGLWLCRHLMEMEVTLVEIDEIDELQKGTMGQNLHRKMMKMRMKMTILEASAQRWASSGRGCSHKAQLGHQGTGTEVEDGV